MWRQIPSMSLKRRCFLLNGRGVLVWVVVLFCWVFLFVCFVLGFVFVRLFALFCFFFYSTEWPWSLLSPTSPL